MMGILDRFILIIRSYDHTIIRSYDHPTSASRTQAVDILEDMARIVGMLVVVSCLSLIMHASTAAGALYAGDQPFSERDRTPQEYIDSVGGTPPGAFKCRQMAAGASFTFPHEWVHFPARANCNLILMGKSVTERQWSDIVQQAYRLQNELEHSNNFTHDGRAHKVNHKMLSLGFIWQKYLAPRARHLQTQVPEEWAKVKAGLKDAGCPLFADRDLPDALHAAWWADVGFTANKMWRKSTSIGLPPNSDVVGDLHMGTLFEVGEGVISWDSYRWYKGTTYCTPLVRRSADGDSLSGVTSREVRAAVTALWAAWCGASAASAGACKGDFQGTDDPQDWARAHPGLTYNAIGAAVSLGDKTSKEKKAMKSRRKASAFFAFGKFLLKSDKHGGPFFRPKVQRCSWNLQHRNKHISAENLELPEVIPRDVCYREEDGGESAERLRAYAPFAERKNLDEREQGRFTTQSGPVANPHLHGFPAWFLENSFDSNTHYGIVSNPRRNLEDAGESKIVNTETELVSIAGMPPFGWDRSTCMMCWTAPVYIANLVRLCGENYTVGFFGIDKDFRSWPSLDKPVVYGCSDGHTGFSGLTKHSPQSENERQHSEHHIFLHARLFEGVPQESEAKPAWDPDGKIQGCKSEQ